VPGIFSALLVLTPVELLVSVPLVFVLFGAASIYDRFILKTPVEFDWAPVLTRVYCFELV